MKMHYEWYFLWKGIAIDIYYEKSLANDFYHENALQMFFTMKMHCQWFWYENTLPMIFTMKMHWPIFLDIK